MHNLSETIWYINEIRCSDIRKNIYNVLSMIKDETYKDDKKLHRDIRNINYPKALNDMYDFLDGVYKNELKSKD